MNISRDNSHDRVRETGASVEQDLRAGLSGSSRGSGGITEDAVSRRSEISMGCGNGTLLPPQDASFEGVTINVLRRDGGVWVTAQDLARALGYAAPKAIHKLYSLHSDEFDMTMSTVIETMTVTGSKETRIFSSRGCYAMGFFSRTPRAAAFRRWVLDVLDALDQPAPAPVPAVVSSSDINQLAWRACHGLWPEMVEVLASLRPVCGLRRLVVTVDTSSGSPVIGVCPVPVTTELIDGNHLSRLRSEAHKAAAAFLQASHFESLHVR